MRLGKYELGRTLGEGNFGKVKFAKNTDSGQPFAVKIIEKNKIIDLNITNQIKREIAALKLLRHPNVVRLYEADGLLHTTCGSPNYVAPEVLANRGYDGATSDTWSCGVLLYTILTGCLPFDDRNMVVLYQKIFKGDVRIPKWLSAGAQDLIKRILDPNPEKRITMAGIKEDPWFKKGYVPANAEDEDVYVDNEAVSMHEAEQRNSGSSPALINAFQLIGMSSCLDLSGFFEKEVSMKFRITNPNQCISISTDTKFVHSISCVFKQSPLLTEFNSDLCTMWFEKQGVSERKIRFTSNLSVKDLIERIEDTVTDMEFIVQRKNDKLKVIWENKVHKTTGCLSVAVEVFEISPSLSVVELRKSCGDTSVYKQLCNKLLNDLSVPPSKCL
ncbi:CBL-interacting serine/threonine-protein [Vigna angularis]|uniref:non-specific serine/threonine protein kinase n=1 Tax=Phaseolus angularis TaxID=3914 RepID=A0A8T0L5C5_PHAAN|nr:CBL-interacting serine/threonine-protein [Vigna angularis]